MKSPSNFMHLYASSVYRISFIDMPRVICNAKLVSSNTVKGKCLDVYSMRGKKKGERRNYKHKAKGLSMKNSAYNAGRYQTIDYAHVLSRQDCTGESQQKRKKL